MMLLFLRLGIPFSFLIVSQDNERKLQRSMKTVYLEFFVLRSWINLLLVNVDFNVRRAVTGSYTEVDPATA